MQDPISSFIRTVAGPIAAAAMIAAAPAALAGDFNFSAALSGEQEVTTPPGGVDTVTTGSIRLDFDDDLSAADFNLRIRRGQLITQAHLHCARAGVNGPVVAFLFNAGPVQGPGGVNINGRLARGTLTNADIEAVDFAANPVCGVAINNIASLLAAVLDGIVYANVHSEDFPPGVVRGQIFPAVGGGGDDDDD